MRKPAAILVLAVACASCTATGPAPSPVPPEATSPSPGRSQRIYEECVAAAGKIQTLSVHWKADIDVERFESLGLEYDRGERCSWNFVECRMFCDRKSWIFESRVGPVAQLEEMPLLEVLAACSLIRDGHDLPATLPPFDTLLLVPKLSVERTPEGRGTIQIGFDARSGECAPFAWLESLRPRGNEVLEVLGDAVTLRRTAERIVVSRTTGVLLEWTIFLNDGSQKQLLATSVSVNERIDPIVNPTASNPGIPVERQLARELWLDAGVSYVREKREFTPADAVKLVTAFYRYCWPLESREALKCAAREGWAEGFRFVRDATPEASLEETLGSARAVAADRVRKWLETSAINRQSFTSLMGIRFLGDPRRNEILLAVSGAEPGILTAEVVDVAVEAGKP